VSWSGGAHFARAGGGGRVKPRQALAGFSARPEGGTAEHPPARGLTRTSESPSVRTPRPVQDTTSRPPRTLLDRTGGHREKSRAQNPRVADATGGAGRRANPVVQSSEKVTQDEGGCLGLATLFARAAASPAHSSAIHSAKPGGAFAGGGPHPGTVLVVAGGVGHLPGETGRGTGPDRRRC